MTSIAAIASGAVKRRSVQGAAVTVTSQLVRFLVQFGSQIALARMLAPAEFGIVAMAAPVLLFVQTVNDMGLGQAIVQRPQVLQQQVSAMFWISLVLSCVLTSTIVLAAPVFGWLYDEPLVVPITRALGAMVLVAGLSIVPMALLNRQMRFIPLAVIDVCALLAGATAGVLAALNGFGVWSLVLLQVVTSCVTLVLCWCFARWRPSWPASAPDIAGFLRFGIHLTGANLATYCSISLDRILIGAVTGKVALGLYDRGYRLVLQPLTQIMAPISRIAVPMLSRLHGSDETFSRSYLFMLQVTLAATLPVLIVNIIMARPIVTLIFGEQWADTAPIFAWICVGGLASSTYSSTAWLFTSQGRTREQMHFTMAASAINVVSFVIGVLHGAIGVAAVSGLSFVFLQTPLFLWGATRGGAVSGRNVVRAMAPFSLAAVATAGVLVVAIQTIQAAQAPLMAVLSAEIVAHAVFCAALACQSGGRRFFRTAWDLRSSFSRR